MPNKIKILTVDDDQANLRLFYKALSDDYEVETADSGSSALKILEQKDIDIVLLDVLMPQMGGYQVCKHLRSSEHNSTIPVLFISAESSIEDRLKGYAAGGNDYIKKPVIFTELKYKIELAVKHSIELDSRDQQVQFATKTAMTAMTNNSELGIIVNFMGESYQSEDRFTLLQTLINSISEYQICCCAQLRIGNEIINACSSGVEPSNLEKKLLTESQYADRIITLGKRALYNSHRVSILIRNMPIDDEDKCGRLADHLAAIVVAADTRCKHIEIQELKLGTRDQVLDSVSDIADEEIIKVQKSFNDFQVEAIRIMSTLHTDIEDSLCDFNLSDNQEDHFYRILEYGKQEMAELSDWGVGVESGLSKIKTTVKKAIKNMD